MTPFTKDSSKRNKVLSLRKKGKTGQEIAETLNITRQAVSLMLIKIAKDSGIDLTKLGGKKIERTCLNCGKKFTQYKSKGMVKFHNQKCYGEYLKRTGNHTLKELNKWAKPVK